MEQFVEWLILGQVIFSLLLLVPVFYWIMINSSKPSTPEIKEVSLAEKKICVILPMRNEISNVERKLSSMIREILPHPLVELIVADSDSEDGTKDVAKEILEESALEDDRWKIMSFDVRGKNVALNGVLETIDSDIIVISDADAFVSPGWLEIVCSRMEEREIGVVSGIEREILADYQGFDDYYRGKSNRLRILESDIDSTPVLEGSILAWKASALGSFRLNERMNADDAQIGFISIRRGYRAIVDQRITFRGFEGSPRRTLKESVRRAQGLSIVLIKNSYLAISNPRKSSRMAIFNALFLYVIFPWVAFLFTMNSVFAFSIDPRIGNNWESASIFVILLTLISRQGRFLGRGVLISMIAHIQAIIGRRYQNWDPVR